MTDSEERAAAAAQITADAKRRKDLLAEVDAQTERLRLSLVAGKELRLTPQELIAAATPHITQAMMYRLLQQTHPGPKRSARSAPKSAD